MSTLEIAILLALGLLLFIANLLATLRTLRYLGGYGFPYLILIWLAPVIGALFVLAKLRPTKRSAFAALASNTLSFRNNPLTIPADPWPTISHPTTYTPNPFRK